MSDRLSTILHDEATTLEVPAAPADQILAQGRGLQRRRRTTSAIAGAVAAVLVAAVATTVVTTGRDDTDSIQPASPEDQAAYQEKGAYAVGDEVHIGDHTVTVPDVRALRYTSLGVIAWNQLLGDDYASTRAETVLITPDGQVRGIDLPGLDRFIFGPPATEPDSSVIAYARDTEAEGEVEIVLADLSDGTMTVLGEPFAEVRAANTRLTFTTRGLLVDNGFTLDPDTGERTKLRMHGMTTLTGWANDAAVTTNFFTRSWRVVSLENGEERLRVPYTGGVAQSTEPSLSLDGRYLAVPSGESGIDVYDTSSGESVHLGGDRDVADYGWTPDGHLVGKPLRSSSEVEVCDPSTGACTGTGAVVDGELTLVRGADGLPV